MSEVATKTDWPAELEQLAREAEADALSKADEIFAKAAAEHERQTAGYRFECRRWGDFLSVFMERQANEGPHHPWEDAPQIKLSSSINIGKSTEIRLVEGHCFDRRGEVGYGYSMEKIGADGWEGSIIGGTGFGRGGPAKGYHYKVTPHLSYIPKARELISVAAPPQQDRHSGMVFHDESYSIQYKTENYPRAAKDDEIRFIGIGTTIYAPAGKGRAVYDSILAEIARGYEPPKQPK